MSMVSSVGLLGGAIGWRYWVALLGGAIDVDAVRNLKCDDNNNNNNYYYYYYYYYSVK